MRQKNAGVQEDIYLKMIKTCNKDRENSLGRGAREGFLLFFPLLALNDTSGTVTIHMVSKKSDYYRPASWEAQKWLS
jgi:hypothetical protein